MLREEILPVEFLIFSLIFVSFFGFFRCFRSLRLRAPLHMARSHLTLPPPQTAHQAKASGHQRHGCRPKHRIVERLALLLQLPPLLRQPLPQ